MSSDPLTHEGTGLIIKIVLDFLSICSHRREPVKRLVIGFQSFVGSPVSLVLDNLFIYFAQKRPNCRRVT